MMPTPNLEAVITNIAAALSNEDAEQALLGALMVCTPQAVAYGRVAGRVAAGDFYSPVHGRIFAAIGAAVERGGEANPVTLKTAFADDPDLAEVGGAAYLADLAASVVTTVNLSDYAKMVRSLARRRQAVIEGAQFIAAAARHDTPLDESVSRLATSTDGLLEGQKARTRSEVLAAVVADMERPPACFSTGLPTLDRATGGGLFAGRLYAIGGLGKAGKSMLAGTISENLNAAGVRHAYVALEMGSKQIEHRKIARRLGINSLALLGNVRTNVLERVAQFSISAPDNTIYVDAPGAAFDELRAEVLAVRHRHRVTGVIIDYWQLVTGRERGQSEEEHLRRVAQWLAAAAARLGIWIVVLAQLADDGEATAVSRTGLNRAADQLYFLRREQDSEWAWLEQRFSRYTPPADVGSQNDPALRLRTPGPWFDDWHARGEDASAAA